MGRTACLGVMEDINAVQRKEWDVKEEDRRQSVLRGGENVMVGSRKESVVMRQRGASDGVKESRV